MAVRIRRRYDGALKFHTAPPDSHDWPKSWVDKNIATGSVTLGRGRLTLHTDDGEDDVVYEVVRTPGVYCVGCGDRLGDDPADPRLLGADEAQLLGDEYRGHVADCDGDGVDPQNPAGYLYTAAYRGERI